MPSDADSTLWIEWAEAESNSSNGGSNGAATTEDRQTMAKTKMGQGDKPLRVLLRVDIQNDFIPGGALAVPGGDEIIDTANELANSGQYDIVVDSQDDHPADHGSFASQHKGKKPFDVITLNGVEQVLWPDHCVNGTPGWEFHPDLDQSNVDRVFGKGRDKRVDSYSPFYDNGRRADVETLAKYPFLGASTGLAEYLVQEAEARGCDSIQVDALGLALGYCVSYGALDGRAETFNGMQYQVRLIENGTRALVMKEGDYERFIADLKAKGIEVIQSKDVYTKIA